MTQQGVFYMEQYKQLQQFESIEALNEHIKAVRERFADDLSKSAAAVLDYLAQHACKVIGVAYAKIATIAEGIGKSERTVSYATKLLTDLGIVKKLEVMRKKQGGNGANLYVLQPELQPELQPVEEPSEPTAPTAEEPKIEEVNSFKNSFKSFKEKELKKSATPAPMQAKLFSNIPERIKQSLELLNDSELGNAIWKKVVQAYVQSDLYNIANNVHLQKLIEEDEVLYANLVTKIHNVVYAHAHGKVRTDVKGFIYGTCKGYFNDLAANYIEDNAPDFDYDDFYNGMLKTAARLTAQQTAQRSTTHYERLTSTELDELGIY